MKVTEYGTIYEAIGGSGTIERLVANFYKRVGKHPDLIPIFPDDLTETARKQFLFLTQFFGGPRLYTEERGHPMMRRRHLPFPITPERRNAWLACMQAALEETGIEEPYLTAIFEKLTMTANHMMNTPSQV
jgi:hemoglobin